MIAYHIIKHVNITNMIIGHPMFWGGVVFSPFSILELSSLFRFWASFDLIWIPHFWSFLHIQCFEQFHFLRDVPCVLAFVNFEILTFASFYTLFDFEVSLIFSILRWSLFAGVDHGCWSCIFKFQIQATGASTTGEKCFVWYTEYNTQGIHENNKFVFFSFARQKSLNTHCGTNGKTHARCLWNQWFYETLFPGVWRLFLKQILLYGGLCAKLRAKRYT